MPREINLPQWGMAMNDGTVVKWLKNVGDQINKGDELVEIESTKVNASIANVNSYVIEFFEDSLSFLLFQTEEKPFPFKNNSEEEVVIKAEEIEDSSSKQETD